MTNPTSNPGGLSPAQQKLLEELLEAEGLVIGAKQEIPKRLTNEELPLSFAQQRLWFLDQFEPGETAYSMPRAIRFFGNLNAQALELALAELIGRHESLRTTFEAHEGRPRQIIGPVLPFALTTTDLSNLPAAQREQQARQLAQAEVERPFDLRSGPLFRIELLRLADNSHVLLWNMHHIISDGWSMGILLSELGKVYGCFNRGEPPTLAPLPIQYADYAIWQREWLSGERLAEQITYWREQLAGAPAVLELPLDHQRPAHQNFRGHTHRMRVGADLAAQIKEMSRKSGGTLFMALLATFTLLLHRYSRQRDIVVGTPVAGRNRSEVEALIGFFVNTLVLRTKIDSRWSFQELLSATREICLQAYAHQDMPFEKLVEELQPERSLSHAPLCQVAVALQSVSQPVPRLVGLEASPFELNRDTAKFDLMLSFAESRGGDLRGTFQYASDLFEAATIERMAVHYQQLLRTVVDHPERNIGELSMLSGDEKHQLLVEWNQTQQEYAPAGSLHQLFEEQVARRPEAVALVSGTAEVTYDELNARANRLGNYLRAAGVGPESLVGVCLDRSLEMVVALLAVLKAGGAYVPIDPRYPSERIAFLLEDTRTMLLITQESLRALAHPGTRILSVDGEQARIAAADDTNPEHLPVADNLAYIIYTSGSTGKPKGVAITHRSAITLMQWARECFSAPDLAGVLASTSICFDLSVFELFVPLSWGGKIILGQNALSLLDLPAANQVTLINTVPSAMTELLRLKKLPASVKTVNLAGEALLKPLVRLVYEHPSVDKVLNLYGPSEDTTYSTCAVMSRDSDETPPIGRPVANTRVYILDDYLQVMPVGAAGELYLSGAGIARGYLNRPDQTAELFLPDPFSPVSGDRMYKTGDLARYQPEGSLMYLGRMDQQVKIRGFRIELREIEAVLAEHSLVKESVVVVRNGPSEVPQLVAYAAAKQEGELSANELRNYLTEKLPEYMVPSVFVLLDSLPLTPNGKVDRQALPDADLAGSSLAETFVAPQTPVEEILAIIWRELLRVETIGMNDNFFRMGGHSLLATQVISRIRELLLVDLPLRVLFEAPTIAELSAALCADDAQADRVEKVARIQLRLESMAPPD